MRREGLYSSRVVGGRCVATRRLVGGKLVLTPLEQVAEADAWALGADAVDVARFLTL